MIEYIKAFALSIWSWVCTHKDEITAFIMSGQFASLVGALILLIRQVKQVKNNTSSTNTLNKTLENTNTMSNSITNLDCNFILLKRENESLREELRETEEQLKISNSEITNKLNAIIEVQSIVYSTIRDDTVRQSVNNILNNARYSDKSIKTQLEAQIEELKTNYANEVGNLTRYVNDSLSKVSDSLNPSEQAKISLRKKLDENTRY